MDMKIIQGKLKSRRILIPANIRPTSSLLRRAIFDIIRDEIIDKSLLDLFAGSGALGFEALSCGAKELFFVDWNKFCINIIQKNLAGLKLSGQAKVYRKNSFDIIKQFSQQGRVFDIILIDPPYHKGDARKALQIIYEYDIVSPSGYVIVLCYRKEEKPIPHARFTLVISKEYGQTLLLIYRKGEN
ncbi:MAG: 16S rRNA (guanine(966)-N(2))-methyltransferase RsmD [Candidatus Omnitrophota bacterium]